MSEVSRGGDISEEEIEVANNQLTALDIAESDLSTVLDPKTASTRRAALINAYVFLLRRTSLKNRHEEVELDPSLSIFPLIKQRDQVLYFAWLNAIKIYGQEEDIVFARLELEIIFQFKEAE